MRPWIPLLLVTAALTALVPTALAHNCSGSDCGACVKGEMHNHADSSGHACNSDLYQLNDAGYHGASHSAPGGTFAFAVLGIAGAALLTRRA